jgi:hypothetical protein
MYHRSRPIFNTSRQPKPVRTIVLGADVVDDNEHQVHGNGGEEPVDTAIRVLPYAAPAFPLHSHPHGREEEVYQGSARSIWDRERLSPASADAPVSQHTFVVRLSALPIEPESPTYVPR